MPGRTSYRNIYLNNAYSICYVFVYCVCTLALVYLVNLLWFNTNIYCSHYPCPFTNYFNKSHSARALLLIYTKIFFAARCCYHYMLSYYLCACVLFVLTTGSTNIKLFICTNNWTIVQFHFEVIWKLMLPGNIFGMQNLRKIKWMVTEQLPQNN